MDWCRAVVLSTVFSMSWSAEDLTFPPGFMFGAATAAYQVEGAWNVSDKGESAWDRYTHEHPEKIKDYSNGDVACDSYHLWKRDIEMAVELGLKFYRFSISWPRLLPSGYPNHISEDGKNYYNNLIDGLLEKGIEPFVTLYHWDLPMSLTDLDWFSDYARVVFSIYGDRVKWWITINEPLIICDVVFDTGFMAPPIVSPELGAYLCSKNVLMAHAKAWRLYDEEFRPKFHGKVSLANHHIWFDPLTPADAELAELAREDCVGKYTHPIFSSTGGWPPSLEKVLEDVSIKRGYKKSSLPAFTPEEIALVRGTYDFYAMNHYTSRLIRKAREGEALTTWPLGDSPDLGGVVQRREDWPVTTSFWFYVYPEGIRRQLVWLRQKYGNLEFVITENGLSTYAGLDDQDRINYYKDYLRQILLAIKEDGVNVTGYTAWTLMDNFEWMDGYTTKIGLYEVDFSHPQRMRTPRASARFYADLIKKHALDPITVLPLNDTVS
ncbi:hypothetical protein PYW08_009069 [Mythimna loreyi]|uniref:Uncharacterized protein n=1 Tax=Mythimna loreyi TaxID=667449 RepID=A0ACC2Q7Q3_9NEOP|nr:hypothetical protein PYW08_009069 [Mythimna loreyi]